jgi:uncharacterized iron-regulated membrane protein
VGVAVSQQPETASAMEVERYKYILQQLHTVNENVYRFLAIYQTIATVLVGAALTLFVRYPDWHIKPHLARLGITSLLMLVTVVALFTILLIVIGMITWLDYRREECAVTDVAVRPGFREQPRVGNIWRWYETYIIAFIVASVTFMWLGAGLILLPAIK